MQRSCPRRCRGGFADSIPFQLFAPRMLARSFEDPLGHLETMHKDAHNACTLAASVGARLPMTELAADIYGRTMDAGHARKDCAALITRYRNR